MPLEKRPFAKQTALLNADELYQQYRADTAAEHIPAHNFEVWANPSVWVFRILAGTHARLLDGYFEDESISIEEREGALREYWRAVADYVLDSYIAGVTFDTPDAVDKSF